MTPERETLKRALPLLAAHARTLGAVIDHMQSHECWCDEADDLYRRDAVSAQALVAWAAEVQTLLGGTTP